MKSELTKKLNIYQYRETPWNSVKWLGRPILKYPNDLMVIQQVIYQTKPTLIIETGTYHGGSAIYYASILDQMNASKNSVVVTIDERVPPEPINHQRVIFIRSSSIAFNILHQIESKVGSLDNHNCLVLLDSSHEYKHVLEELRIYSSIIKPDNYLIVEDTHMSGNPIISLYGDDRCGGPNEAVNTFLKIDSSFYRDKSVEIFLVTQNPGGYLKKHSTTK